jgi:hypothetical protein
MGESSKRGAARQLRTVPRAALRQLPLDANYGRDGC